MAKIGVRMSGGSEYQSLMRLARPVSFVPPCPETTLFPQGNGPGSRPQSSDFVFDAPAFFFCEEGFYQWRGVCGSCGGEWL